MPDISMCNNCKCAIATHCYRYMAKPDMWQSYIILDQPVKTEEDCEHYWRIEDAISPVELQKTDERL